MNQAQRNYLIKKIEESVKIKTKALESSIPHPPSLNNYLLHAVMSNNFEIKSTEELKEMVRQKALRTSGRDDWMGSSWGNANKDSIHFAAREFFVIPEEYTVLYEEYRAKKQTIDNDIAEINLPAESLITRIHLASDKTLQRMINEVDDMGDLSLLDTKIKLLSNQ